MTLSRDNAFQTVCMLMTKTTDYSIGTGFFILKGNKFYITTAAHVAKFTNSFTIIILGDNNSIPINIQLVEIAKGLSWRYHPGSDIALIEIDIKNHFDLFSSRFFPYEQININPHSNPSRDQELTIIGFPKGLGSNRKFGPFTFRSFPASGIVSLSTSDDLNDIQEIFCLENPSCGGYSGGPVLDLGYIISGNITQVLNDTKLYGIIKGTIYDNTGGKISVVTPSYLLEDFFK